METFLVVPDFFKSWAFHGARRVADSAAREVLEPASRKICALPVENRPVKTAAFRPLLASQKCMNQTELSMEPNLLNLESPATYAGIARKQLPIRTPEVFRIRSKALAKGADKDGSGGGLHLS